MEIARDFSGHLNLDSHAFRVGPKDYVDALNITRSGEPTDVSTNVVGNRVVNFTFHAGVNITVGAKEDKLRNRIIEFVYNSQGYHTIIIYNKTTGTRTKLFQSITDTGGIDILNLQPLYKVKDIDIIYRDSDGDLVFFNDAYNRPGGFNIDVIGTYAPNITDDLIRLSKKPPLVAPIVAYDSDPLVKVNNLRKKLYQFMYRPVYKDNYKSTWSPISKVQLPSNGYSIVTDIDPTKNNVILVTVQAPLGADFEKIEIAARQSNGIVWTDFFIVDTLNKNDYDIDEGATYTYRFYNDTPPTFLDPDDAELQFDRVPDEANTQALANGNVLVYGGITEGFNQIPRSQSNVQVSYISVDTSPNEIPVAPPNLSWTTSSSPSGSQPTDFRLILTVGPYVAGGDRFHVEFTSVPVSGTTFGCNLDYIALNTDTTTTARDAIRTLVDAALGPNFTVTAVSTNQIKIETHVFPSPGAGFYVYVNVYATPALTTQGSNATWKWNSRYQFGLIYFDDYGKPLAIMSYKELDGDPNVYTVTTPNFNINGSNANAPRVPVITASVGHIPIAGAKYFQWIRSTNLSVSKFLQYITCQIDSDAEYFWFCIANLDEFKVKNTGFLPSYQFTPGDRLRVMDTVNVAGSTFEYSASYHEDDYEILGEEIRAIPNAGVDITGRFLKVRRPSPATTYNPFQLIEIYTPALRTNETNTVFYEFGEVYPIYVADDGNRYHVGNIQNQTALQNAHFEFIDGDVYFKFRKIYNDTFSELTQFMMLGMMDANYSDYWQSAFTSNGRPWVLEPNTRRTYNPVLVRFGNTFQQGTDINALNRFYPDNYDEYVRDYGDIMKMFAWNNSLIVGQRFKIGRVPVLQQIWEDASGVDTVGVTQKLLNRIQYYVGEYGVGDHPESVAYNNSVISGWDNYRGVNWRISQNGLTPISIIHNANNFSIREAGSRGFNYKIYQVYNAADNEFISAFEETNILPAKTLSWDESSNGYRSPLSYFPEFMCCVNNLLVTWKNGQLYTHDNPVYNNFYGVQYDSFVTAVFNDRIELKKSFNNVYLLAGQKWDVPEISTNNKSNVLSNSPIQQSNLIEDDFEYTEGNYYAAFKGDTNSIAGGQAINNADYLKGAYIILKIRKAAASTLVFLNAVIVGATDSQYNNKQ